MVKYLYHGLHQWSTVDGSTCKYCTPNMVLQSAKNKWESRLCIDLPYNYEEIVLLCIDPDQA